MEWEMAGDTGILPRIGQQVRQGTNSSEICQQQPGIRWQKLNPLHCEAPDSGRVLYSIG